MTRNEVLNKMVEMAISITGKNGKNYSRDTEREIWRMCSDWNSEHYGGMYEEAEIFMCEYYLDKDGNEQDELTGFCIEDDYFLYED